MRAARLLAGRAAAALALGALALVLAVLLGTVAPCRAADGATTDEAGVGATDGTTTGTTDGPGSNALDLRVDRLDHASQADVAGDEANAMLFSPQDTSAVEAARAADAARRQDTTRSLFTGPTASLREPASSSGLFTEDGSTTTRRASDADDGTATGLGTPVTWALIGLALLLVAGIAGSATVREPEGPHDE